VAGAEADDALGLLAGLLQVAELAQAAGRLAGQRTLVEMAHPGRGRCGWGVFKCLFGAEQQPGAFGDVSWLFAACIVIITLCGPERTHQL
jgi:hypothetical protein